MTKEHRGWRTHVLGGRVRTSTLALVVAFLLTWWLYDVNRPEPPPPQAPATQVVPPGFVPDPNYTWVPRTDVQERTTTPRTTTPTPTTTTTTPTETTSPTSPTDTTTSGSPTSPTTTTPAPPGAPPASPSPAMPGPGPSPTPSS